jgi:CubicO group peptidase (beta-lactamase class C family)
MARATPETGPASRPEALAALATTLRDQIAREAATAPDGTAVVFALVTDDGPPPLVVAHGLADREGNVAATPDTVFRIASVTKTFTAAAVLALRDAGAVRLDDKVSRFLPELATASAPHRDDPAPTLRHLLLHAAGLPRSGPWVTKEPEYRSTEEEVIEAAQKLVIDPGTRHSYSNLGYAVLGLAVGRVTKTPYRDVVTQRFLGPLGMRSSTYDETKLPGARIARGYVDRAGGGSVVRAAPIANGAAEGAGGLWSTGNDLARWVRFQLAAWPPRDDADRGPLRRATIREGHMGGLDVELVTEPVGDAVAVRARSQGLGWKVERSCAFEHLVEHGGDLGGYRTRLWLAPQRGIGFVLLANAGSTPLDAIARRVLATIADAHGVAPRAGAVATGATREGALPRCVP